MNKFIKILAALVVSLGLGTSVALAADTDSLVKDDSAAKNGSLETKGPNAKDSGFDWLYPVIDCELEEQLPGDSKYCLGDA